MRLIFPGMTYPKVGGAENLTFEVVRHAYQKLGIESVLLGNRNSFVATRLKDSSLPYTLVERQDVRHLRTRDDDLFVHYSNNDWLSHVSELPGRAVVWGILAPLITNWNRFEIERRLFGKKRIAGALNRQFVRECLRHQGLYAMDGATADAIESVAGAVGQIPILAVPISTDDVREIRKWSHRDSRSRIVVSYIGRSDDRWKIYPVRRILRDLSRIDAAFFLDIYTDRAEPFQAMIEDVLGENTEVRFSLGCHGAPLRDALSRKSDLHVSMGISALEGALSGVPTALVDPSFADLPDTYKYLWLHESNRCSLGRFIQEHDTFPGHSMEELVYSATDAARRTEAAEACIRHVVSHHSPDTIVRALIDSPSTLSNRHLGRWTPSSWGPVRAAGRWLSGGPNA